MSETKDFNVIRVARSDGADTGPGYWPVTPVPTTAAVKKTAKDAAAPEKTPRAKPQMTRLTEDDPRYAEWRIKLGILLKQELSPHPDEGSPWYVQFPRGYWLYEKSKHLWVSGYPIKTKLFKSPQEFGLHLIWLLSASKDYRDCCCVHCNVPKQSASDDGLVITPTEAPAKAEKMPPKVTPVPLPTILGQPSASPVSEPARSKAPISSAPITKPQLSSKSATPSVQPPAQPQQPPPSQQINWSLQSPLLFRTGELVWYQNGNTWRLGLIAAPGNGTSELMPIGHGMIHQRNVAKADGDMRPFYAFSVPPVAIADLKEKMFDEVPWDAMFQATGSDAHKRDVLALDASKMAASKVDYTYSLWSALSDDLNGKTVSYYGCFLGAERIELGDCLRLRSLPADLGLPSPESSVLAVRFIFTTTDYPGAIFFRGHIYQPTQGEATSPTPDEHIPVPLRDETQWQTQLNPAHHRRWRLVKENVVLKEQSIRGRFYPMHRLMAVLNPAGFQEAVARRRIDDQVAHMNNRMDGGGRYIGRKRNRIDTLGAAVPHAARVSLDPHIREEAFQTLAVAD